MSKTIKRLFYAFITVVLLPCIMTGCASFITVEKLPEESTAAGKTDNGLSKVADHLYEITITEDYDWGIDLKIENAGFSCSGIQNGQYRGRNYDWYYDDTDLCVVHTPVSEKREHASVGVADLSFITADNGTVEKDRIPFVTVDGINDVGMCVQVNVMPCGENGTIPHTESKADDLSGAQVTRLILDYADNVEEALELLKKYDIETVFGEEELHWMISGPASASSSAIKTVVVEMFPDGMHVTDKFVDNKPIMTNFNISNFNGSAESVGWGLGFERWQILNENFAQANSVMGTFDLMEKVFYSRFYDLYSDRFWYSEYALTNLCDYYTEAELVDKIGRGAYDRYMAETGGVYYTPILWDGETCIKGTASKAGIIAPVVKAATEKYNSQNKGYDLWITVETAVYDLKNQTLDLSVRESQDHYHFTIVP